MRERVSRDETSPLILSRQNDIRDPPSGSERCLIARKALDDELKALNGTATNFAYSCVRDARVREQYLRDMSAMAAEVRYSVTRGILSPEQAAEQVRALRNEIMDLARTKSSPIGRSYAMKLKAQGRTMEWLLEKYAQKAFRRAFAELTESQQTAVYLEIIQAAARPDSKVVALARMLGKVGRRIYLVSVAVAAYEIWEADDKGREVLRQGVIGVAGPIGGVAGGAAAVATGACAATAPLCVGLAALIGGLLFSFGSDWAFGSIYPTPGSR
jgi:hypothetical protein